MSLPPNTASGEDADEVRSALAEADAGCPFGPGFFIRQLHAFLRDRCPDPSEALPSVQLHLAEGEVLEVCHIIGIAPRWLALAVVETVRPVAAPTMRTEIVPYGLISRITVRPYRSDAGHVGFEMRRGAEGFAESASPEAVFLAMAGAASAEAPRSGSGAAKRRKSR